MNIADKMERESRLMGRLADWMEAHGTVLSDRQRSNAYTGVRIREIKWRGRIYRIVDDLPDRTAVNAADHGAGRLCWS